MWTQQTALAHIIGAIGQPGFAAEAADAVCRLSHFELATIVVHRRQATPGLLYDNFDADGRRGIDNYVQVTHVLNPMLRPGRSAGVVRASAFTIRPRQISEDFLVRSPDEELGFRTVGWPQRMEEIGLYFDACGGIVEFSLYRPRAPRVASDGDLDRLDALRMPIAAAFDRNAALTAPPSPAPLPDAAALTPREREIVELLLQGCTSEAIALRLHISRHTVKDHRKRIFRKLGIGSLGELFARQRLVHGHG
jgi:DNA-binding CsgD family transcriptional regulator